ncbi:uncharacterized protein LOC132062449 [Lycium ferocissimum]|uniref:uncharacterized protein LOC132062449 n=1 Tax=Lycium ferocissimum TaxID=112874 RepID=UPI002815DAB5|nr:uncharacterized protein LOC132062449 [Lycium ferocissimum]
MEEPNQVESISAKAWIENNFGKQLNDKWKILSQQVSKVNPGTPVRDEREHDSEETGDTLLNKNLEKGLEEDKSDEIEAQVDHNCQEEKDLTQNIDDIAQEAYLSPRSVQKLKQATNKQKPIRNTSVLAAEVSTRRKETSLFYTIEKYRRKLGYQNCKVNCSGKIWIFWTDECLGVVISESEQQVTLQLTHPSLNQSMLVSLVYAKCDRDEREVLWESMVELVNQHDLPWLIEGDFNIIVFDEEKQGGLPVSSNETLDFSNCIQSCGLIDVGFSGSKFTWWNGRTEEDCIFKRLDRILVNQQVLDIMPSTIVTHMIRHGSDHAPLHLKYNNNAHHIIKSFKFLNFWTNPHTFMEVVKENWTADLCGNPFYIATIEDTIKVKELQFETNASRENRMLLHQAQAELTKFLHLEEEYWKQKAGMKWFNDGDRNTKFFHSYVRGRRNKLALKRIQDPNGTWLENEADIGYEAIRFFESQFSKENSRADYAFLKNIPKLITEEQQKNMEELPSESEVKEVVLSLNGANRFTGHFYQKCWEIIKIDVVQIGRALFFGYEIPQFITHTNLVLLPKNEVINNFNDMRPISLSSFSNKILSKVLHNRLAKGRSIAVLLAQEIIRDINLRAKHANVVIKFYMAKAYDRSSRRVKHGDPLSPTLFIIVAEALTRSLNKLHEKPRFISYGMPKWSPQINHLSYVDDTILFFSGDGYSLKKMMKRLRKHEKASGQLVNTDKSCYYTHHKLGFKENIEDLAELVRIRCGRSLWRSYMLNKYCKKWHPTMAVDRGGSHTWKKMITPDAAREEEIKVRQFVKDGEWNMELLIVSLDQELA